MFKRLRERLPARPAGAASTRIEVAPLEARILPAGSLPLVYSAASGSVHQVSPAAAELLAGLEGCRPPWREGWQAATLMAAAEELARHGLVVSRAQLLRALREATDPVAPPPVAAVAWITRGRPAALARSIRSYAANAARHERAPRWLVFDDGDANEAARTLEALRPVVADRRADISYCGPAEKARMIERLSVAARHAVPEDLIRFALNGLPGYGSTHGANRNATLLAAAGSLLLEADDDTVCDTAFHPERDHALAISSARDPSDLICFGNREALRTAVPVVEADFVGAHEALLGRAAWACARGWPDESIDLAGLSPALAGLLIRQQGRVAATSAGVYGAAISNDRTSLLWLEGEPRERALSSAKEFAAARGSDDVLRCPRRDTIGDSDLVYGGSLGLDCRAMLPPFLPVGRGEDLLFGCTLQLCFPGALVGRPAIAVLHDPVEPRPHPDRDQGLRGMQAHDFIGVLERGHAFAAGAATPEQRLRSLGGALEELGRLPVLEFAEAITPKVLAARSAQLSSAEGLLRRYRRAPEHWADAVERYLEATQEQVAANPITPLDTPRRGTDEETLMAFQVQVGLYGALLKTWPELWQAARELSVQGPWAVAPLA